MKSVKHIIVCFSETGNTLKVAEAIREGIGDDSPVIRMEDATDIDGFDLLFVGFPIRQFGPPAIVKKFAASLPGRCRVALFITHGAISDPDDPFQQEMLTKEMEKCKASFTHCEITGVFHCQGELSASMADMMINSGIPMLEKFGSMHPETMGHPNEQELEDARRFARKLR